MYTSHYTTIHHFSIIVKSTSKDQTVGQALAGIMDEELNRACWEATATATDRSTARWSNIAAQSPRFAHVILEDWNSSMRGVTNDLNGSILDSR